MAPPYAWRDKLIDRGWLRVLRFSELIVLLTLGRFMNGRTMEAWPAPDKIADLTGLTRSTVYGAINGLGRHGLIESEIVDRPGRYRTYRVELHRFARQVPFPPTTVQGNGQYSAVVSERVDSPHEAKRRESPTAMRESEEHLASSLQEQKELVTSTTAPSFHSGGTGNGTGKHVLPFAGGVRRLLDELGAGPLGDEVRAQILRAGQREGLSAQEVEALMRRTVEVG